jgi:aminoglycoside phosphotransferase (APT) family kinase protein
MTIRSYSSRLGPITDHQFATALHRLGLGEFVRAESVSGGLFGQNQWVLRGDPHTDEQLWSERFFVNHLQAHTSAPVPWPYLIDDANDIFGWPYAVMPRMPGMPLSDRTHVDRLSRDDRLAVASALGTNLAMAHQLIWDMPGSYDRLGDRIEAYGQPWESWIAMEVESWLARARHSSRTTDADVAWVHEVLAAACSALAEPFPPRVVFRDYGEHNVVVKQTGDRWAVTGMFDLMEASVGDGEMDLARQVARYLEEDVAYARSFLSRYLEEHPPREGFATRFPVYMLRDRLIVWEYGVRPDTPTWWDPRLELRAWAEPYTASLGRLVVGA